MRKLMNAKWIGMAAVFAAGISSGSTAFAAACGTTTYNNWLGGGFSCTVGNQTYSNFSFQSLTILASQITVGPDLTAPANSFGLEFQTGALSVTGPAGATQDISIDFNVSTTGAILDDAYLTIAGSVLPVGTGVATVGETITTPTGSVVLQAILPGQPTAHVFFDPTASLSVLKDALVISLPNNTVTSISAIKQDFSEVAVPEPASLAIFGAALTGLGLIRRRRRRNAV